PVKFFPFDRVVFAASPELLQDTLSVAVVRANQGTGPTLSQLEGDGVSWRTAQDARAGTGPTMSPLEGGELQAFLRRWEAAPEGYQQGSGGAAPDGTSGTPVVGVAWWSDRLARKHCRVVATRDRFVAEQVFGINSPSGADWPVLWRLSPERVYLRSLGGRS